MDENQGLKKLHDALCLRKETLRDFTSLATCHMNNIKTALGIKSITADTLAVSFLTTYGHALWPRDNDKRRHLIRRSGARSGTHLVYIGSQDTGTMPVSAFQLYQRSYSGMLGPLQRLSSAEEVEALIQLHWEELPDEGKKGWEEKARRDAQALEEGQRKVLDSDLGRLVLKYFGILSASKQFRAAVGTPERLLADILRTGPRDQRKSSHSQGVSTGIEEVNASPGDEIRGLDAETGLAGGEKLPWDTVEKFCDWFGRSTGGLGGLPVRTR